MSSMPRREPPRQPRAVQARLFAESPLTPPVVESVRVAESAAFAPPIRLAAPAPLFGQQFELFAPRTLLLGDVGLAIARADFAAAIALRTSLLVDYPSEDTETELAFLDPLAAAQWNPPLLDHQLSAWLVARALIGSRGTHRHVAQALFSRLMTAFTPEAIAAHDRDCLLDLVAALWDGGHGMVGRNLVRDGLLRGWSVAPDDVDDPVLRDILAEDGVPARLACWGEVRHAWGPHPADDALIARVERTLATRPPKRDDARALQFWDCLCISEARPVRDADMLLRARQRMKQLDGDIHAAHLAVAPRS